MALAMKTFMPGGTARGNQAVSKPGTGGTPAKWDNTCSQAVKVLGTSRCWQRRLASWVSRRKKERKKEERKKEKGKKEKEEKTHRVLAKKQMRKARLAADR